MHGRRLVGAVDLLAGLTLSCLIWRTIAWMSYGGVRDYVQFALYILGLLVAVRGAYMLCFAARTPDPR